MPACLLAASSPQADGAPTPVFCTTRRQFKVRLFTTNAHVPSEHLLHLLPNLAPPPTFPPPDYHPLLSRQGKLCLVLDLDHTLLNSATFSEVGRA